MITKHQFLRIICFLLIVILCDQIAGRALRKLYFAQKSGPNSSLNYALLECKEDVLIFGNSRAQHHYNTKILSDGLQMTCYNAGQDGGHSILMQYAQIKLITARYLPKIILLEFNPDNVVYTSDAYDRLSILLPYYSIFPDLHPIIQLRSQYERVKLLSEIYPFNSNIINIIRFNTDSHSARKRDFEGYVPIKGETINIEMLKLSKEIITPSIVDTNMINALKNIIQICKKKNISLFIINSPIFHTLNFRINSLSPQSKQAIDIIHNENVPYFDMSNDSTFSGKLDLFVDKNHLNEKGAIIFSELVTKYLCCFPNTTIQTKFPNER